MNCYRQICPPGASIGEKWPGDRKYDEHAQALYAFLLNLTRDLFHDIFIKVCWFA